MQSFGWVDTVRWVYPFFFDILCSSRRCSGFFIALFTKWYPLLGLIAQDCALVYMGLLVQGFWSSDFLGGITFGQDVAARRRLYSVELDKSSVSWEVDAKVY
ncbi:hypothetical protein BDY21DRAFT_354550 [Lineolata rhizophorae]|uniref:Uncharacterized protein n=1 Tax=Lineolata rhizophorae TaxID=578093 RepID=A0A6A6NR03_9PEZI|nr:hypothetical protein BDY21DRAFT_354550 [Lineolata rhizophorae]